MPLFLFGCATTPPPGFYLLATSAPSQLPGFEKGLAVGVGPVQIPSHLDRNQIVSRVGATKLWLSEKDQWAEPLRDGFTRVLLITLGLDLDSNRIYAMPSRTRHDLDYQVAVDVLRFDGVLGQEVILGVRWALTSGDGDKILASKVSLVREATAGNDYTAFVAAQSRAVTQLGHEIAETIKLHMSKSTGTINSAN
jgi:uncharacterized lipoprotein YmbA